MANIVLAHGVLGFDRFGLFGFTIGNYFNGVEAALKADGHKVYAPDVSSIGSVERRAGELSRKVVEYCEREDIPWKSLIILAHSMGGLDARKALAEEDELRGYTKTLVTIGTPHQGSPIADLLAQNLFSTKWLYRNFLKLFGDSVGSLNDLTQARGNIFDRNTITKKEVNYYSIAGTNQSPLASFFLKVLAASLIKKMMV